MACSKWQWWCALPLKSAHLIFRLSSTYIRSFTISSNSAIGSDSNSSRFWKRMCYYPHVDMKYHLNSAARFSHLSSKTRTLVWRRQIWGKQCTFRTLLGSLFLSLPSRIELPLWTQISHLGLSFVASDPSIEAVSKQNTETWLEFRGAFESDWLVEKEILTRHIRLEDMQDVLAGRTKLQDTVDRRKIPWCW